MRRLQTSPLLVTKLFVPRLRFPLVSRERLLHLLGAGASRKLTLVSAPAGSGKTTLVSEWARQATWGVGWVSLDEGDNDPLRFWIYFIAALQTIQPNIGLVALSALQSQPHAALTTLVNEIAAHDTDIALVLDDYHVITNPTLHEGFTYLLDYLPPQMHLTLISRAEPPLPLPRLRARDELHELRAADLRFTPAEASVFLQDVMHIRLLAEEVAALDMRTEGWIAGIQMAALSMRGHDDVAGFIRAFTGSNRHITDYLDDILSQQPRHVQDFLLQTSILDRLTGDLCNALTGRTDGNDMLRRLEALNLFVLPLDDERRWYRYHHLFGDFLRDKLHNAAELHRRASTWYEAQGLIAEAVNHALAAKDADQAARLIGAHGLRVAMGGGVNSVLNWLQALPPDTMQSSARLLLTYAWARMFVLQLDGIETVIQHIDSVLARSGEAPPQHLTADLTDAGRLWIELAALRANAAVMKGDTSQIEALNHMSADIKPEDLPDEYMNFRSGIVTGLALAYSERGDILPALTTFTEATDIAYRLNNTASVISLKCGLGYSQALYGDLRASRASYEQAIEIATASGTRHLPYSGIPFVGLGATLREMGELESAATNLMRGIEVCERTGIYDFMIVGLMFLARTRLAQGDIDGTQAALREIEQRTYLASTRIAQLGLAYLPRLWLALGDTSALNRWKAHTRLPASDVEEVEQLSLARIYIARSELESASTLLAGLLPLAQAQARVYRVIEILTLCSLIENAQGKHEAALTTFGRALALGEPGGFVRVFLDEGAPVFDLLRQPELLRYASAGYIQRLSGNAPSVESPLDALKERELDVLRLIAGGLSNREIGDTLSLTVGTVNWYTSNIYSKLGVHSRTQAIARAKALNLLPSG